jgi:anthranilate/para-aminobenzoate synthase component II
MSALVYVYTLIVYLQISKQTSEAKQITKNKKKPDTLIISPGSPAVHRPSPVFPIV